MEKNIENKIQYEKPMAFVSGADIEAEEAYSAAAVPAFAPAVEPVIYGGTMLVAGAFTKWC